VDATRSAIEEVARYCDLLERLPLIPPSAQVRGLYFRSVESVLAEAGLLERYHALFPERRSALGWHPTSEFLEQLAVAAGILSGPPQVAAGMFEIGRRNARAFAESLLGRTLMRFLARDPRKLLQQAIAGRRQSARPSRWELSFPAEHTAVMSMVEEYMYLDSYYLGAAHGTFETVGVPVRIECVLEDRFCGRHVITW